MVQNPPSSSTLTTPRLTKLIKTSKCYSFTHLVIFGPHIFFAPNPPRTFPGLMRLHGQFSRGFQDQRNGSLARLQLRLRHDVDQGRQQKTQRLAAASRSSSWRKNWVNVVADCGKTGFWKKGVRTWLEKSDVEICRTVRNREL